MRGFDAKEQFGSCGCIADDDVVAAPTPIADSADNAHDAERRVLQQYLAAHGSLCPACGYNLRGVAGPVCPECGIRLELRLGFDQRIDRAFLAGLIGLSGALGFCWLLTLWATIKSAEWIAVEVRLYLVLGGSTLAVLGFLVAWFRLRGWLSRQSAAKRWTLALLCWILQPFALLVALLAFY